MVMNAKINEKNVGASNTKLERAQITPNDGAYTLKNIQEMVNIINEGLRDVGELPVEYKVDNERKRVIFGEVLYNISHSDLRTRKYRESIKGRLAVMTARKLYQKAEAGHDFQGNYYIIELVE